MIEQYAAMYGMSPVTFYGYFSMVAGRDPYYIPEGFRGINHILLKAEEELQNAYNDLVSRLESQGAKVSLEILSECTRSERMAQILHEFDSRWRDALVAGRPEKLPALVNANFDLRDSIFHVAEENRRMVMTARRSGASAKFAGSGGAIVGTYEDEAQYAALERDLAAIGCRTLRPTIATTADETAELPSFANWRNS